MTQGMAVLRLTEERKLWKKDHPYGFIAKPIKKTDGTLDLMNWHCAVPGVKGTLWEGGLYTVKLHFNANYPSEPPKCVFSPPIYHPNVWESGMICLSIIDPRSGWRPSITIKQILLGIQQLLDEVNIHSPANIKANNVYMRNKSEYAQIIKQQAQKFKEVIE
ncbi:hypothetical protein MIR68_001339 [Amoeboaphelidium protococcarum]|nr:hypothetical protein MIR68_001339 [Amoeboaphelidium protococcarum]